MTELEKVAKGLATEFCKSWPQGQPCYHGDMELFFERGFEAALKPEHMKLTSEVKALIKALEYYADIDWDNGHENGRASEALKPFGEEADE